MEIMVDVRRKPPEKGQAPQRVRAQKWLARLDRWAVVRYALLAAAGGLLYQLGAACALRTRGYFAVGGEAAAERRRRCSSLCSITLQLQL